MIDPNEPTGGDELVYVPRPEPSPLMLIERAIDRGIGMEHLKDLVELARQLKADRAAEAWAEAVTKFQARCLMVKKTRQTTGTGFTFKYASLDDVMDVARAHLQECGLVVSFTSRPAPPPSTDGYEITCNIRHGTHVEATTITLPSPKLSNMDAVQKFGQVVSYGKRYALCAALNIVISDEDDDATRTGNTITPEQAQQIRDALKGRGKAEDSFLKWVKTFSPATTVEEIGEAHFDKVMDTIERMGGKK